MAINEIQQQMLTHLMNQKFNESYHRMFEHVIEQSDRIEHYKDLKQRHPDATQQDLEILMKLEQ